MDAHYREAAAAEAAIAEFYGSVWKPKVGDRVRVELPFVGKYGTGIVVEVNPARVVVDVDATEGLCRRPRTGERLFTNGNDRHERTSENGSDSQSPPQCYQGKTYGGLLVAKGLGSQRTIVIDTEQGSSDLYDRLHDFDVIDLAPPFTPEAYIEAIDAAEQAGADCIVIDSISHEWNGKGGCLELVDEIARAKFKGNTWSAWSELTPRHRAFIDRMLRSSAHIIATGRSKTETAQVDDHGRKKVVKLGMRLESRDGAEYEFTTVLDIVHDGHFAVASKDRTGIFGGDPKPISVETGERLAAWLAGGTPAAKPPSEKYAQAADYISRAATDADLRKATKAIDTATSPPGS